MKKILYYLFILLVVGFVAPSCNKNFDPNSTLIAISYKDNSEEPFVQVSRQAIIDVDSVQIQLLVQNQGFCDKSYAYYTIIPRLPKRDYWYTDPIPLSDFTFCYEEWSIKSLQTAVSKFFTACRLIRYQQEERIVDTEIITVYRKLDLFGEPVLSH